jgi:hypothetical protein
MLGWVDSASACFWLRSNGLKLDENFTVLHILMKAHVPNVYYNRQIEYTPALPDQQE